MSVRYRSGDEFIESHSDILRLSFEKTFPRDGFFGNLTKTGETSWTHEATGDMYTVRPGYTWDRKVAPKIKYKITFKFTAEHPEHLLHKLEDIPSVAAVLEIEDAEFIEPFTFPPNLSYLHLKGCTGCHFLGKLPDSIRQVYIHTCPFGDASHLFSPSQVHLESVTLSNANLHKVPDVIPPNVIVMNLSQNCITELPATCCFHKRMAHVNLNNNAMTDLPKWIVSDTSPDTTISMQGNRFWFNAYTNISLNRFVQQWHFVMADRFFGHTGLYNNFLRVRNIQQTAAQTQQVIDYELRQQGLNEPYDPDVNLNAFQRVQQQERRFMADDDEHIFEELARIQRRRRVGRTTAEDGQNVHLPSIQRSFGDSVKHIMEHTARKNPDFLSEMREYYGAGGFFSCFTRTPAIVKHVQLMCVCPTICSRQGVTYKEILERVWAISGEHEHKDAIRSVLKSEIQDGMRMCFTGQVTRIANSLSGFMEGVEITISVNEQISNAMVAVNRRCEKDPSLDARTEAKKALDELKVPEEQQQEWLLAF